MILSRHNFITLYRVAFTLIFLGSTVRVTQGQTTNNNMIDAEVLKLNQFVHSKTHGNTVEVQCVDKSLTGKCIEYHNDQWYTFTTDSLTHLYVNISGQKCRSMLGVQLVVLTGDLCAPSTYAIYDCVSLATQDDIFVELRHLRPSQKYWLNVDGYLHDFCSFFIEVSDQPKGFSADQRAYLKTKANNSLNTISIEWTIPDSLASLAKHAVISQRKARDFKFDSVATVPVQFNAYGSMTPSYQFRDTLMLADKYIYRLGLVLEGGKKLFIDEFSLDVPAFYGAPESSMVSLHLDYKNYTPISILIIDPENGNTMDEFDLEFDPKKHAPFSFYINKYRNRGLRYIEVKVINEDDNHSKSHYFKLEK